MKELTFLLIFLLIPFSNALCEKGQIDINAASLEDLDELTYIGPAKAQAIIETRPYSSVDDLIDVYGIGPSTLEKIKNQDLACVGEENTKQTKEEPQNKQENDPENLEIVPEQEIFQEKIVKEENKEPEIINLNPKTIKTEEPTQRNNKNFKYFVIGVIFLLISIYLIKPRKLKNEFN